MKVLGHFAVDEMYLNNITSSHFGEEKARKVYAEFKRGLDKVVSILSENSIRSIFRQVEKGIEERNAKLLEEGKIPYTVLLPRKIPTGIAV